MAKFVYSMQNVLNIKERLETQAKTEYAEKVSKLQVEEDTMRRMIAKVRHYEDNARELSKDRLDIGELRRCNDAIRISKEQVVLQGVRVRVAQKDVDVAMEKLTEAIQDRKVHEKLKEKAFEDFKQELNAQESKEVDEIVSFNYNNKDNS